MKYHGYLDVILHCINTLGLDSIDIYIYICIYMKYKTSVCIELFVCVCVKESVYIKIIDIYTYDVCIAGSFSKM